MSRFARNKDGNHQRLVKVLEAHGCAVVDLASHPTLGVDLFVFHRGTGGFAFTEVKDSSKPPSKRQLTPREAEFRDLCHATGMGWRLIQTDKDAVRLADELRGMP